MSQFTDEVIIPINYQSRPSVAVTCEQGILLLNPHCPLLGFAAQLPLKCRVFPSCKATQRAVLKLFADSPHFDLMAAHNAFEFVFGRQDPDRCSLYSLRPLACVMKGLRTCHLANSHL